jgi:aspartokinase/homoserine dehydrogenase 1
VITCAPQQAESPAFPLPEPAAFEHLPHEVLRPPRRRLLAGGLVGPGGGGGALLELWPAARPRLAREAGLELRLCGVAASKRMWLDCDDPLLNGRDGGSAQTWRPSDLDQFAAHVRGVDGRHALLVDCSASEQVAARYPRWLAAGLHLVTPNKLACSGPLARWQAIREACAGGARFRYEATVGAGLPVVQTLRDLLDTGDQLLAVEGMFSGTLAWLCNRHDGSHAFSALVREAHAHGYTEPDPRDDLSGVDVARKLVILAREAGWPLSLEEVEVESLVPAELATLPVEDFLERLEELDAPMAARLAEARAHGSVLRHVASLDRDGRASVRLDMLPAAHPFAHTRLTDNVVQFRTRRYCDNPLLVQGPGAGPEVTAAGVFADLLRIAEALEARA